MLRLRLEFQVMRFPGSGRSSWITGRIFPASVAARFLGSGLGETI
jgi:hypothetical protein